MKEKLLFIAQGFPPMVSMGSIRNYKMAKAYTEYFDQVFVITPDDKRSWPEDKSMDTAPFEINQVGSLCLHTFVGRFPSSVKFNSNHRHSRVASFFRKIVRSFPFNLFLNGGGLRYIFKGYKRGKTLIEKENIRYIQTSYPPMTDHAIGWLLKRKFPKIVWIADFRDLVVEDRRKDIILPRLQNFFLKKLLKKADFVTTVSNGLATHLRDFKPNVQVLWNGIPTYETTMPIENNSKFTITYTGSIYRNLQKPQLFLQAISELIEENKISKKNIQFLYRGKNLEFWKREIAKHGLSEIFNGIPPIVSLEQSRFLQNHSHINLLLSWSSKDYQGILTGKIYEYMASGKPVGLIINGERDFEFEEIFNQTKLGQIFYTKNKDVALIKEFILKYYEEWLISGKVSAVVDQDALEKFRIENIVKAFVTQKLKLTDDLSPKTQSPLLFQNRS